MNTDWRPVRMSLLARLVERGWTWISDPRRGLEGRAIRSPGGEVYELRTRPTFSLRRYRDPRIADAA